jgi:hypothetical protein
MYAFVRRDIGLIVDILETHPPEIFKKETLIGRKD